MYAKNWVENVWFIFSFFINLHGITEHYNLNNHQLILNGVRYGIALYNNKIQLYWLSRNSIYYIKIEKENKNHILQFKKSTNDNLLQIKQI